MHAAADLWNPFVISLVTVPASPPIALCIKHCRLLLQFQACAIPDETRLAAAAAATALLLLLLL